MRCIGSGGFLLLLVAGAAATAGAVGGCDKQGTVTEVRPERAPADRGLPATGDTLGPSTSPTTTPSEKPILVPPGATTRQGM